MTCPQCGGSMDAAAYGHVTVRRCSDCAGVFLARADLGALIEAENDWHAHQSTNTATLPRITADMTEAPVARERSRAFVEALFKA
ncbi:zf-TFIIB domain-containing protein [Marmoricola sp. RAF53]|uniref:TFIIB-type zinc ribbon-containing protein n=1 Tax=Marmoricola sp. RAF53 TaxID=3233059 RepID=UPI003F953CE6